jgi:hypothetical protein
MIKKLPNIVIKHVTSKTIQHTDEEKTLHSLSHHLAQDARIDTPIPRTQIPKLHQTSVELLINDSKISSNYIEELRKASAKPDLWTYYQTKYNWSYECIETIDWSQHGDALSSITGRQQKTIKQFLHKWLPINT